MVLRLRLVVDFAPDRRFGFGLGLSFVGDGDCSLAMSGGFNLNRCKLAIANGWDVNAAVE